MFGKGTVARDGLLFVMMLALTISGLVQGRSTLYVVIMGIFAVLMGALTLSRFLQDKKAKDSEGSKQDKPFS
jgi:hypothetical protein